MSIDVVVRMVTYSKNIDVFPNVNRPASTENVPSRIPAFARKDSRKVQEILALASQIAKKVVSMEAALLQIHANAMLDINRTTIQTPANQVVILSSSISATVDALLRMSFDAKRDSH